MTEEIKNNVAEAFEDYDEDLMASTISGALAAGEDPMDIIGLLSATLEEIGEQFSQGKLFLPDMVMAGDLMEVAMGLLNPALMANEDYVPTGKKIIYGTVRGDVHDIGKNMVKMMWVAAGYEVIDLGIDVAPEAFLNKAVEAKPDIVAMTATMTTTAPSMKDTIELLRSREWKTPFKIVVGGGSMTPKMAEEMGADAYGGKDAYQAVQTVKGIFA
ncbi:cobalamin-dependent protein [Ruminococcaceae bacterium OttesenSCG-928-A11]|nr:cobalamin-dependent protein [Ruminococcaceae bacterium OttesenSCG-928-A11]